ILSLKNIHIITCFQYFKDMHLSVDLIRFLYNNVKIQNIQDFKNCYNRFIRIENLDNRQIYSNVKIKYISSIDSESTTNDKQLLKERYFEFRKSNEFTMHVKIGLRYWSIFLFTMKVNNLKFTKELFNTIELNISIAELVREVIYLRDKQYDGYLEWRHWDYMERESGVSYSPPDPRNWLIFGLLIDLIRNGITDLHYQQYSYQEKKGMGDLFRSFVDKINIFRNNFENWKELINCESLEILEDRVLPINSFFENIEQDANFQKIRDISTEKLDQIKKEKFEESIRSDIKSNSMFLNIIDSNIIDINESKPVELKTKLYVANLKGQFINGDHSFELSSTNSFLARQFSDYIDDNIIYALNSNSTKLDSSKTKLSETLLSSFENIKQRGEAITSVIVASDDFYDINDRLYSNNDFVQNNDSQSKFLIGKFKGINIYITKCRYSLGKILLWNQEVLKLNLDTLDVKVSELTKYEINAEYEKNKPKWAMDKNDNELSKDISEAMIKNGINICFSINYYLQINDKNSVFLAEINNSIS
ncbi:hypothetical protein, partial [Myroides marinus]|uniref:hypothetical protein n=1 Tax=Myroides marinus TaxID=703342 RepID=UPI0025758EF9